MNITKPPFPSVQGSKIIEMGEVYFYYDIPLLFSCSDENQKRYLAIAVDSGNRDEGVYFDSYLIAEVTGKKEVAVKSLFSQAGLIKIDILFVDQGVEDTFVETVLNEVPPKEYLPTEEYTIVL